MGQWKRGGITMKKITWPGNAIRPPKGKPKRHFLRITTLKEEPYVIYRDLSASGGCDVHSVPCSVYPRARASTSRCVHHHHHCCCYYCCLFVVLLVVVVVVFCCFSFFFFYLGGGGGCCFIWRVCVCVCVCVSRWW